MIYTSRQLKALARNQSKEDSAQAQIFLRNYVIVCHICKFFN